MLLTNFSSPEKIGSATISELEMERSVEEMERQCWDKINSTLKTDEEQDEQDDSIICDVCRAVSGEVKESIGTYKTNLIVFLSCPRVRT